METNIIVFNELGYNELSFIMNIQSYLVIEHFTLTTNSGYNKHVNVT